MNFLEEIGLSHFWNIIKNIFVKKQQLIDLVFPIGSIYCSVNNVSPSTYIGGFWQLCCQGEVIVGVDKTDSDFIVSNLHGGEKEHSLSINEMPAHNHGSVSLWGAVGDIAVQQKGWNLNCWGIISNRTYSSEKRGYANKTNNNGTDGFNLNATHTHNTVGSNAPHNNLQPYITCYIWTRIK